MNNRTSDDLVELNYAQIIESEKLGYRNSKNSTSQGIMVALALADRRFAEPQWQDASLEVMRARLDVSQLAALKRFRNERGL